MVARLTLRQGTEAVLLLLQRARWDASGLLVAIGLDVRDMGTMSREKRILVTNMSPSHVTHRRGESSSY